MGLGRLELPTSRLSGVRSSQLSYRPIGFWNPAPGVLISNRPGHKAWPLWQSRQRAKPRPMLNARVVLSKLNRRACFRDRYRPRMIVYPMTWRAREPTTPRAAILLRKEVIQPQVLLQLPCYDFTPIIGHTVSACLPCGLAQRFRVQPTFVM